MQRSKQPGKRRAKTEGQNISPKKFLKSCKTASYIFWKSLGILGNDLGNKDTLGTYIQPLVADRCKALGDLLTHSTFAIRYFAMSELGKINLFFGRNTDTYIDYEHSQVVINVLKFLKLSKRERGKEGLEYLERAGVYFSALLNLAAASNDPALNDPQTKLGTLVLFWKNTLLALSHSEIEEIALFSAKQFGDFHLTFGLQKNDKMADRFFKLFFRELDSYNIQNLESMIVSVGSVEVLRIIYEALYSSGYPLHLSKLIFERALFLSSQDDATMFDPVNLRESLILLSYAIFCISDMDKKEPLHLYEEKLLNLAGIPEAEKYIKAFFDSSILSIMADRRSIQNSGLLDYILVLLRAAKNNNYLDFNSMLMQITSILPPDVSNSLRCKLFSPNVFPATSPNYLI